MFAYKFRVISCTYNSTCMQAHEPRPLYTFELLTRYYDLLVFTYPNRSGVGVASKTHHIAKRSGNYLTLSAELKFTEMIRAGKWNWQDVYVIHGSLLSVLCSLCSQAGSASSSPSASTRRSSTHQFALQPATRVQTCTRACCVDMCRYVCVCRSPWRIERAGRLNSQVRNRPRSSEHHY